MGPAWSPATAAPSWPRGTEEKAGSSFSQGEGLSRWGGLGWRLQRDTLEERGAPPHVSSPGPAPPTYNRDNTISYSLFAPTYCVLFLARIHFSLDISA